MPRNSKISLFALLLLALVIPFATSSAQAQSTKYSILKNGQEAAKVSISTNDNNSIITIEKPGQVSHVYTKSFATGEVIAKVGDAEVFRRNIKSKDFTIKGKQSKTGAVRHGTEKPALEDSIYLKNSLSDDMKILQAVRTFDKSVKSQNFELAYVILTEDESSYWGKDNFYSVRKSE